MFGERDRIGAVVAEPLSDKNPLATEISALATLVLAIVIAIPVPQPSDLPKTPAAQRLVAIVAAPFHDRCPDHTGWSLGLEPGI